QARWRAFHRHRGPVLTREIRAPAGNVGMRSGGVHVRASLVGAGHHAAPCADGGMMTGLLQLSRLLTKMSSDSATAASGIRWAHFSSGETLPARSYSISSDRQRVAMAAYF